MDQIKSDEARMLTPRQLSELIGIDEVTLTTWRRDWEIHRRGPQPIKLGPLQQSPVRYRYLDVLEWQRQCVRGEFSKSEQVEAEYERQKAS